MSDLQPLIEFRLQKIGPLETLKELNFCAGTICTNILISQGRFIKGSKEYEDDLKSIIKSYDSFSNKYGTILTFVEFYELFYHICNNMKKD